MEPGRAQEKSTKAEEAVEDDEEDEEEEEGDEKEDDNGIGERKRRALNNSFSGKRGSYSGWVAQPSCQAENCSVDMTEARRYHRRHKVCEFHAKAPVVQVAGLHQRFCQQCSRFHELKEFDDAKRSCRRRLAGHNERRRKSSCDLSGEGFN